MLFISVSFRGALSVVILANDAISSLPFVYAIGDETLALDIRWQFIRHARSLRQVRLLETCHM